MGSADTRRKFQTYDALRRPRLLYEIKTGYRFLLSTDPRTQVLRERTIGRFVNQSEDQAEVAQRCDYDLVWVFNEPQVAEFVDGFIQPPVDSVPFPCDVDK